MTRARPALVQVYSLYFRRKCFFFELNNTSEREIFLKLIEVNGSPFLKFVASRPCMSLSAEQLFVICPSYVLVHVWHTRVSR